MGWEDSKATWYIFENNIPAILVLDIQSSMAFCRGSHLLQQLKLCENVLVKEVIWHIHGLIISHEKVIVVEFLNWKQLFHAHGLLIK
jgi:hypothetical protein